MPNYNMTLRGIKHAADKDRVKIVVDGKEIGEYDCSPGGLMGLRGDSCASYKDLLKVTPDCKWPDIRQIFKILRADYLPDGKPPAEALDLKEFGF